MPVGVFSNFMTIYQVTDQQVSTSVSGETVILNFGSGIYYNLDEVGTYVWDFLQKTPSTLGELVGKVCTEFDVTPTQCEEDLNLLLKDLINEKLITETN